MISNKDELKTIISSKKQELAQIKRKEYLFANKEKISAQKKIRHQINSDDLKRRNKEYHEKNKKYVHDTFTSKVECSCGQVISLGYTPPVALRRRTRPVVERRPLDIRIKIIYRVADMYEWLNINILVFVEIGWYGGCERAEVERGVQLRVLLERGRKLKLEVFDNTGV
jgi:hypothetical protein